MRFPVLILVIMLLSCSVSLSAQEDSVITDARLLIDSDSVPALKSRVDLSVDVSRDYFEDFMKEKYDIKVKGNGFLSGHKMMTVEQETISLIHENALDMFIDFKEVDEQESLMLLAARNGYDLYFDNTYASESRDRLKGMMRSFISYAMDRRYQRILEEEQALLEELQRAQKKKEDKIAENEKEISDNLSENQKLREENEELSEELSATQKKLNDVKVNVSNVKMKLAE